MTITTFQVDPIPSMQPYAFERDALKKQGGALVVGNCNTEDDVLAQAGDAEILLLSWKGILTPRVMDALPNVRLMVRWGVGYDMIDVNAATTRGIAVANTPTYATEDVAEHAIALLMSCARAIPWLQEGIRAGEWPNAQKRTIHRMVGRTFGTVGIGRIGAATIKRAKGLGLRVLAFDKFLSEDQIRAYGAEPRSFEQLLAESDYISVHVPLSAATRHLIDAKAFALMKPGAIFINTSRGPVVDEPALIEALRSGHLSGAGLDVFEQEPMAADNPLRTMDQAVVTPHSAAYSIESWHALREEVVDVVSDWMRDSWSSCVVNPQVRPNLRPRAV
jgi:D-3-phosphoglycerate dehydrogenase